MKYLRLYILTTLMALTLISWSQQENRLIRQGNREYVDGKYKEAEIEYLKSTQTPKASHKGFFNLGNAWYMQDNYLQASAAFDTLRTFKMDDRTRSQSYYNLGNSLVKTAIDSAELASQALQAGIEAYKQTLRLNPDDEDAKYNLAFAQMLLSKNQQQQQQQQQNKDQKQQDQQQQDQQQQDQQQQDQQKENQEQQKQEQQKQEEQQQEQQAQRQQQQQSQQISKEDAERILEALKNDEKQTLEKLKQAKIQSVRVIKSDKDW